MEGTFCLVLFQHEATMLEYRPITQTTPGPLWAGGSMSAFWGRPRRYSTGAGQTPPRHIRHNNGKIQYVWMLGGQNDGELGDWKRRSAPPACSANKAPPPAVMQTQASVITVFLLKMFIFFSFLILSKTKSRPPVEILCRGWVLGEPSPSPSPSETPGRHSTSQHLPFCSPVRFHPLVLTTAFILFPSTLLPSNKSTFLPLFPVSPLCRGSLPVSPSVHPTQPWPLIPFPIPVTSSLFSLQLIWKSSVSFLLVSFELWFFFFPLSKQQSELARIRVCGKAQGVGLNK